MIICSNDKEHPEGTIERSLVYHSPDMLIGTVGKVVRRWRDTVFAVETSLGALYRWLDLSELQSFNPEEPRLLEGTRAWIISDKNYNLQKGDIVSC